MTAAEDGDTQWEDFGGASARERIRRSLAIELVGPGSDREVLDLPPSTRYLTGMLAPAGTLVNDTEDEDVAAGAGEESDDSGSSAYASLDPSAIGISFVVQEGCEGVSVTAEWGEYQPVAGERPTTQVGNTPGAQGRLGGSAGRIRTGQQVDHRLATDSG